jgi:hypothetical protein
MGIPRRALQADEAAQGRRQKGHGQESPGDSAMSKKPPQNGTRAKIVNGLKDWSTGRSVREGADTGPKTYVLPSRKGRKAVTTWLNEGEVQQLSDISHKHNIPQQVLMAEGLRYVLAKYGH